MCFWTLSSLQKQFSILYIIDAQIDIWSTIKTQQRVMNPELSTAINQYKWIFLFSAFWVESHGMAASVFLSTYLGSKRTKLRVPAWLFNTFFLLGYAYIGRFRHDRHRSILIFWAVVPNFVFALLSMCPNWRRAVNC